MLDGADVLLLREEFRRHTSPIVVDIQGQNRIEGARVGALDALLKLVAGARYRRLCKTITVPNFLLALWA